MIGSLLRRLADKLEPLPVQPAVAEAQAPAEETDSVGLKDDILSGWFNVDKQEVAPGFRITRDDIVVDVGCGTGGPASFCARFAGKMILVDGDKAALDAAVARVSGEGASIEGHVADAAKLPLGDASVTRVVCTEVLEHVDNPAAVMAELARIGKPGALYLLSVPAAACEKLQKPVALPVYFQKPNHIRIVEADELERLATDVGLVIESRSSYGFFRTLWLMFFWGTGLDLGKGSHPLLEAWTKTWSEVLKAPDRDKLKGALDELAPRVTAIVARKPG